MLTLPVPTQELHLETSILFDPAIGDALYRTYQQLKVLADGKAVSPPLNRDEIRLATHKGQACLYQHLKQLKAAKLLDWAPDGQGNIVLYFADWAPKEVAQAAAQVATQAPAHAADDSKVLESENLESPLKDSFNSLKEEESLKAAIPESRNSRNLENGQQAEAGPEAGPEAGSSEDYRERTHQAIRRGLEALNAELWRPDVPYFPEHLREFLGQVCIIWHMRPPGGRLKRGSPLAHWLRATEELLDACGEFGLEAVRRERQSYLEYQSSHNGLAPYRVQSPESLIKSVRARARELREAVLEPPPDPLLDRGYKYLGS